MNWIVIGFLFVMLFLAWALAKSAKLADQEMNRLNKEVLGPRIRAVVDRLPFPVPSIDCEACGNALTSEEISRAFDVKDYRCGDCIHELTEIEAARQEADLERRGTRCGPGCGWCGACS